MFAAPAPADTLEAGFQNPPDSARPQTWWHWMNGNVTHEGITADLEAMKSVGIGGAEIFNVDEGIPPGPVKFLSPEWRQLMVFAAQEANRLGLDLCLHNCAGWSSSGGPWNAPAQSMQQITTSEQKVKGPVHFTGRLPQPPARLDYYRDFAVMAFPDPAAGVVAKSKTNEPPKPLVIDNIAAKGGFNGGFILSSAASSYPAGGIPVSSSRLVDLTHRLSADGKLDWEVPAGDWVILRIGATSTGKQNHPAPREATGLECDKFSRQALEAHWAGYVQKVIDDLGPLAGEGKTLNDVLIDSYEVGGQNWTPEFRSEFRKRRGYDPLKYLPALSGRVVDSPEISERFLWDWRRTIADLFAENYYGHFAELCHQHGLKASLEPYTGPFDSLQCGQKADIPMGEFWVGGAPDASIKLASSIGHIYGRPIIGAESFTAAPGAQHGRWLEDPYSLKALGDLVFCQGVNRLIFHRFAMQPWTNRWPGMTMGQWGTHFDRTSTWWNQSRAWISYLTRCQFLLQQGRFVADVAYFCGQSAPNELRMGDPPLPPGYDYDAVGEDALRNGSVRSGRLVLPSGASYAVLVLPPSDPFLTPALLRKLAGFVEEGLTVVGAPPPASPSLQDYPKCDAEVRKLAGKLWSNCDGKNVTSHTYGKGKVCWGQPLAEVLRGLALSPDVSGANQVKPMPAFIHRQDGDTDIYFVSNQRNDFVSAECSFRCVDRVPELWNPLDGSVSPAPVWRQQEARTIIPLALDPAGSIFVVFRSKAPTDHLVALHHKSTRPRNQSHPAEVRILRAEYGVFADSAESWSDVTTNVQALVAAGTHAIPAGNALAGDDPAPMIVKELRVQYRLQGLEKTEAVDEGSVLNLPEGAEVIRARYGQFRADRRRTVDLKEKLSALVDEGRREISVNNDLAGGDPVPNRVKELRVEYSIDGKVTRAHVAEGDTLALPSGGDPEGGQPVYSLQVGPDGRTELSSRESGEFVFDWSSGRESTLQCGPVPRPVELPGPWEIQFPPGWGAPESVQFAQLQSWTDSENSGVKYFSGTVTYTRDFELPAARTRQELWLDLGKVKNIAEVRLNGVELGILWKPPFRVKLDSAAKPGTNRLEIKVTNLWPNRLIGDEQLPADCEWSGKRLKSWPPWLLEGRPSPTGRLTFTTWHHWTRDGALLESGLLGPVRLECSEVVTVPSASDGRLETK